MHSTGGMRMAISSTGLRVMLICWRKFKMNHYTFELTTQHRPEVLERVLRVIRLRGFTVTNMDMALVDTQVQLKNHCKI